MNYPLKTNRLKFCFDCKKLESLYDFFCIKTTENSFMKSPTILDMKINKNFCAIKYERGSIFYAMLKRNDENHEIIKQAISQDKDASKISFSQVSASSLEKSTLLQLLINSLSWTDNEFLSFNNLTGKLYCFDSKLIKKGIQNKIKQIICLEIKVEKDLSLSLNVETFTNIMFKNKRKYEEYPQYVISNRKTLKRKTKLDNSKDTFILHQFKNQKANIPFLSIASYESFNASKIGILSEILDLFNQKLNGIAKINFENIIDYKSLAHKKSDDKKFKLSLLELLKKINIIIVDEIGSNDSASLVEHIQDVFKKEYNVDVPIKKQFCEDDLNIAVIHNKDWYDGKEDQHFATNKFSLQHITLEDFSGKSDFAVKTIVNELIIKHDIKLGHFTIFDWQNLNYNGDWIFGIKKEINEELRYFFMTIHCDGSFEFAEKNISLFPMDKYSTYSLKLNDKDTKAIIINNLGEINFIKDTKLFTLPQFEQIKIQLLNGNNKLRSKEKRDELLTACLDIKYINTSEKTSYYFVGTIGEGMQQKINDACIIREIVANDNNKLFFEELLPLMDITFVRNGQLTVVPFPLKFLREWIAENYEE